MASTAGELFDWLNQFKEDELVAIDEGGLTIVKVADPDNYFELGGIADIEEDEPEVCTCDRPMLSRGLHYVGCADHPLLRKEAPCGDS